MAEHLWTEVSALAVNDCTLSEWMMALSSADHSRRDSVVAFLEQDRWKIERLLDLEKSIRLPIDHYLVSDSTRFIPDAPEIREYFASEGDILFSIRAIPAKLNFAPYRTLGITQKECFQYADRVSRAVGPCKIYVWDHFVPEFSGTIIISRRGIYGEMCRGDHTLLTQQAIGRADIITASLAFPNYRMMYSTNDVGARTILWQALKHLMVETSGEISPLSLPVFLKGYFEFAFHSTRGYRFFDFNCDPLIAKIPCPDAAPDILS